MSKTADLKRLMPETVAELQELLSAQQAEIARLREGIKGVINAYGDKGWAKSEMCRRLGDLLHVAIPDQRTEET